MTHKRTLEDIRTFYQLMDELKKQLVGIRTLNTANGKIPWPKRGVYFFFEPGETRSTSGVGPRVVRIGTHGLIQNSKSTLWGRLRNHKGLTNGQFPDGGNHRGSVFRNHVGEALINKQNRRGPETSTWGRDHNITPENKILEYPLEREVSQHIRSMPFVWLAVDDLPGPESMRGYIERNAIALLSNFNRQNNPIDPPSETWLGNWAARSFIRESGLWNVNHVAEAYDPKLLNYMQDHIMKMKI